MCFLAEILTTIEIPLDGFGLNQGETTGCDSCGQCIRACPTGALMPDGKIDSNRCLNYLTIEHRGEWSERQRRIMRGEKSVNHFFGCDRCIVACPLNRELPATGITEFNPLPGMLVRPFPQFPPQSPLKRPKAYGLARNLRNTLCQKKRGIGDRLKFTD